MVAPGDFEGAEGDLEATLGRDDSLGARRRRGRADGADDARIVKPSVPKVDWTKFENV